MDIGKQLLSFNRHLALERIGGDEELLREIAGIYLCEYGPLLEDIRTAVSTRNCDQLMRTAHTLKGSLGTLGAEAGAKLAYALETQGRQQELHDAESLLSELEGELNVLRSELEAVVAG
ncbi:MAG: Hpt domain-containing protein [Bryobacterales bacterium]|nr:Hpt domain-containing protein [Bryobacterales bacterium]